MLSAPEIRRRIRSIGSTAQITRAMQMVAASKMRKAQQAALRGRPFVRLLYRIQRRATTQVGDFVHPLTEVRPIHKQAVILIGPDKGLCGGLNSNLYRVASRFDPQSTVFITAGRKMAQFIARTGRQLIAEFNYSDAPRFAEARAVAAFARDLFLSREVDVVQVVAAQFVNTLTQRALSLEYLPIGKITSLAMDQGHLEEELVDHPAQVLFEPAAEQMLDYLLPIYLNVYIFQAMFNAKASEQSARMVSMKNATDNAERLIKDLTLEYNKLRQNNITRELLDIAGGKAGAD
jgi:F-type H+-transporting ATPase subunit gamma